jgi:hypothetical protein
MSLVNSGEFKHMHERAEEKLEVAKLAARVPVPIKVMLIRCTSSYETHVTFIHTVYSLHNLLMFDTTTSCERELTMSRLLF